MVDNQNDESEEDFARMRDLLRSTQDEVDRIIQGTNSIQEVYTESQQFVSQTASNPSGGKPNGL